MKKILMILSLVWIPILVFPQVDKKEAILVESAPLPGNGMLERVLDWTPYMDRQYGVEHSPLELSVQGAGSEAIYEATAWYAYLHTTRKGSWTISGKLELLNDNPGSDLYVSAICVQNPMNPKGCISDALDLYNNKSNFDFYLVDVYGIGQWEIDTNWKTANGKEFFNDGFPNIYQPWILARVTADAKRRFIFSEYSFDGIEWMVGRSIDFPLGESLYYGVEIYNSHNNIEPARVRISNLQLVPAMPYAVRTVSKDRYRMCDRIHVTLCVTNPQESTAPVSVVENIPDQWTVDHISHDGDVRGNAIHWSLDLQPGTTVLSYTMRAPDGYESVTEFFGKIGSRSIMGFARLVPSNMDILGVRNATFNYTFVGAISLAMMLLHLGFFVFYPKQRQHLYYSIFLGCAAALDYLGGMSVILSITTQVAVLDSVRWLFFSLLMAAQASLLPFFYSAVYDRLPRQYWGFIVVWLLLVGWIVFISLPTVDEMIYLPTLFFHAFLIASILFCIESIRVLIVALMKKCEGTTFVLGALILMGSLLYSLIVIYGPTTRWPPIIYYHIVSDRNVTIAFIAFIISMSIYISYRSARSHKDLEKLNIELEDRVERRTQELNSMNVELQEANAQLIQLDQMKTQFVSQASHDLRTPLTAIKGSLDNLLMGIAGALNEKQQKVMTRATTSVDRLTNLINDVLDLNRIETGRVVLEKSNIPFKTLVENIMNENHPAAELKKITLNAKLGEEINLHIDGGKIERVVGELISNAIKYTPDNGKVDVGLACDGDMVSLSVKDSGIGMTPEECTKIWERFYRTSASQKFAKGSGLGLSIAKELVELHGGSLAVESEQGEGTTFSLLLPHWKEE